VLNEKELLKDMPPISEIRERIIKALYNARRDNPLADYYE